MYTSISSVNQGAILWSPAEMVYSHYAMLKGINQMAYTKQYRDTLEANPADTLFYRLAGNSPIAPAAPTGVAAAAAGNRQAEVSWNVVPGATSYSVMRSINSGWPFGEVIATGVAGTSVMDTNLAANTTYYYAVSADNATSRSAWSTQAAATTIFDPNWIAVKSGLNAPEVTPFSSDLYFSGGNTGVPSMNPVVDTSAVANPAPNLAYIVERYGAFTYTFPGLVTGASYKVRLHFAETYWTAVGQREFNVFINGSQVLTNFDIFAITGAQYKAVIKEFNATANSSGQIVIQFAAVVDNPSSKGIEIVNLASLAAPTNLVATATSSQVVLTWPSVIGASSYNVYCSTTNGGTYVKINSLTGTSYTNSSLNSGTTYYYVVTAVSSASESAYSIQVVATPSSATPAAPSNLVVINDDGQAWISWNTVTNATSYNVYRSTTNGGPYSLVGNSITPSYPDLGINDGTTYYYVVTAVSAVGEGASSTQVSATPHAPAGETWTGGGADNNWTTAGNWGGVAPALNDSLRFAGSTRLAATNNFPYGVTFNSIVFNNGAGAFGLGGNAIYLANGITNLSTSLQTISANVELMASQNISASSGNISLNGVIDDGGSGFGPTLTGPNKIIFAATNTYSGTTTVNGGTLQFGAAQTLAGSLSLANAISGTILDLNGFNVSVAALPAASGLAVITNSSATPATLLVNGAVDLTGESIKGTTILNVNSTGLTLPSATVFGSSSAALELSANVGRQNNIAAALGGATLIFNTNVSGFQSTTAQTIGGGVTVNGTNNNWNFQNTTTVNGSWTGSGAINLNQGFSPTFTFGGNLTGFQGTLRLQANGGTANNSDKFDLVNTANPGGGQCVWNLIETGTGVSGNVGTVTLEWNGGSSGNTYSIPLGDLTSLAPNNGSSPSAGATGAILLSNAKSGTTANYQIGSLNHNSTFGGIIQNGFGTTAVTKVGTGTWTLTGTNTYSGLTTVSNGTLFISTLHSGGGNFLVTDGSRLGVMKSGGVSAAVGSLTLGNAGSATLMFTNVSSTTSPLINALATVNVNGTNTIQITSTNGLVAGSVYPLIKYGLLAGAGVTGLNLSMPANTAAVLTNDAGNSWIALKVINLSVNTNVIGIATAVVGGGLQLSWPADHIGWSLQSQTDPLNTGLGTNWVTLSGSSSTNQTTIPINPTSGSVFYRLVYP
jgi:autotransporter-associated beta strand protein